MLRFATVKGELRVIARFLPSNYEAFQQADGSVLIVGSDNAGWTLDGYVLPRLASGMHFAREIPDPDLEPGVTA